MFNIILYSLTIVLIVLSYILNKNKTKQALIKAVKSFESILPLTLVIMISLGFILVLINNDVIVKYIGPSSGALGILIAAILGSIVQMAGFIAYPLGATLLNSGAGISQVGTLISSIMMVGIISMPLEVKYWGNKITFMRNGFAFIFAIIIGLILGVVCG